MQKIVVNDVITENVVITDVCFLLVQCILTSGTLRSLFFYFFHKISLLVPSVTTGQMHAGSPLGDWWDERLSASSIKAFGQH